MARLFAIFAFMLGGIAACATGPQYRTDTNYIAPPTVQGATCAASCQTSEQVCRGREDDRSRAEYPACMQRARTAYNECIAGYYPTGCDVARQNAEHFCNDDLSPSYKTCTRSYNSCYKSCGGQVIQKEVCVKNCDG